MSKRFLWILLFITPLVIVVLAVWLAKHKPQHMVASYTPTWNMPYGVPVTTDLHTSNNVYEAIELLKRERQKWALFTSLSGHITIQIDTTSQGQNLEPITLDGALSLRQVDSVPDDKNILPFFKFRMTITNKMDGWDITTDGTKENTKIRCSDESQAAKLGSFVNPMKILEFLCWPKLMFLGMDKDSLCPQANQKLSDLLGPVWYPRRDLEAPPGLRHCCVFKDNEGRLPAFYFREDHLYRIVRAKADLGSSMVYSFEEPVEVKDVWYPTKISVSEKDGGTDKVYTISLSAIK